MTQTSSSKQNRSISLFFDVIKRNKSMLVVYTIIMFLATSLVIWISGYNKENIYMFNYRYNSELYLGFVIVGFIAAICFATVVTRFMHQKTSIDLYFALPINRNAMFTSHFLAGAVILMIPFIINMIIILIIQLIYSFALNFLGHFFIQMLTMALMTLVTYSIAMFTAVLLGTSFDTFTMSIVTHFALPLSLSLIIQTYSANLYGYVQTSNIFNKILITCPTGAMASHISRLTRYSESYYNSPDIIGASDVPFDKYKLIPIVVWVLIGIGLFFISRNLFQKRKSEISGYTQENSLLVIILKLVLSFAGGFFMMYIFYSMITDSLPIRIIGFIIGASISFIVLQGIAARGFKTIAKSLKQYIYVALFGIVLITINKTGGLGYVKYVPEISKIENIYIEYPEFSEKNLNSFAEYSRFNGNRDYMYEISDPNQIEIVTQIHQGAIDNKNVKHNYSYDLIRLEYHLNNGKTVERFYQGDYSAIDDVRQQLITEDYIKNYHPIYDLDVKNLKTMSVSDMLKTNSIDIESKDDKQKFIDAMQKDILEIYTNGEVYKPASGLYKINIEASFEYNHGNGFSGTELLSDYVEITSNFKNTIALIEQMNISDKAVIDINDINDFYILKDEYLEFVNLNNLNNRYGYNSFYDIAMEIDTQYNINTNTDDSSNAYTDQYIESLIEKFFTKVEDKNEMQKYIDKIGKPIDDNKYNIIFVNSKSNTSQYYQDYMYLIEAIIIPN